MDTNLFTVTPMNHTVSLKAGDVYTGTIKVTNPDGAAENFKYKIEVTPYGVTGNDNTADFTSETAYTQIVNWIKVEEPEGEVEPNSTKEVNFTITVPQDAPGGGQYAAIMIGSNEKKEASDSVAVQNVFDMASLVYAEIDGEIEHDAHIVENNIPGFVTGAPITLGGLLTNDGNVHEYATVIISAKEFFTGNVIVSDVDQSDYYSEIVMPDSARYVERNIEQLPMLGIVHVVQTIRYGGDISTEERNVIICPIWFMLLVVATISAITYAIVQIVKGHKKKTAAKLSW